MSITANRTVVLLAAAFLGVWLAAAASWPAAAQAQSPGESLLLPPVNASLERRILRIRKESANDPDKQIAQYGELLAEAERDGRAGDRIVLHTLRAQQEARANRFDRAVPEVNRAIGISTAYPLPFHNRAAYEMERGNAEPALRDLAKAIELEPRFDAPYSLRARILHGQRKMPEALADFATYLGRRPDDAGLRAQYAVALNHAGDPAKALIEIDKVLVRQPHSPILLLEKAVFLGGVRDDGRAVALVDKVMADGESSPQLHFIRGKLNLAQGEFAAAEADMKTAFDRGLAVGLPHPYSALYLEVARMRLGRGDPDDLGRRITLSNVGHWPDMLGDALRGRITPDALLANGRDIAAQAGHAGPIAEAHYFIAQRETALGRRDAAAAAYAAAVATNATWTSEHGWSRRELERMGWK